MNQSTIPGAQGVEPDATDAERVLALVREHGEQKTREILGVDRLILPRLIARLPVRRGTLECVREKLGKVSA